MILNEIRITLVFIAAMLFAILGILSAFSGNFIEAALAYILAILILIYSEQIQLNKQEE